MLKNLFRPSGLKVALFLTLIVLGTFYLDPDFLSLLELKTLDLRFLSRGKTPPALIKKVKEMKAPDRNLDHYLSLAIKKADTDQTLADSLARSRRAVLGY